MGEQNRQFNLHFPDVDKFLEIMKNKDINALKKDYVLNYYMVDRGVYLKESFSVIDRNYTKKLVPINKQNPPREIKVDDNFFNQLVKIAIQVKD